MYSPEKHSQNEKLKALKAHVEMQLDILMEEMELNAASIRILLVIIELIEAGLEPDHPG